MPTLDFTNRAPLDERHEQPTNERLSALFAGISKVIIKDEGVYLDKAMSDTILLVIAEQDQIHTFQNYLQIDEDSTGFYCMCLGTYAIELYAGNQLNATIGFHHGTSIRYHLWKGDAGLAKSDELLNFLATLGFSAPLEKRIAEKQSMEASRIAERKWLDAAPKTFRRYWAEINNLDYSNWDTLLKDLNEEIPDRQKLIIALLQTFGKTDNFWTAYPSYEELPNDILKTFETREIIDAYLKSDRNYKTRKGLGRFLCSFDFKKIRKEEIRHIEQEVINDLEKCFEWLGEKRGINEIFSLQVEKNKS